MANIAQPTVPSQDTQFPTDLTHDPERPTLSNAIRSVTMDEAVQQAAQPLPYWQPPLDRWYRPWRLRNPQHIEWSPIQLFLLYFEEVLAILMACTGKAAIIDPDRESVYKPFTELEWRSWLAIRLALRKDHAADGCTRDFWSRKHPATAGLSVHRFDEIERYLCLTNEVRKPSRSAPWFWKIAAGINAIRVACQTLTIPSSHFSIDEICIAFFGRCIHGGKLPDKPAKQGFLLYGANSKGGMLHDFLMHSRINKIEDCAEGTTFTISTRSTRRRARGATGVVGDEINLPMIRAAVLLLCQRLRARLPLESLTCFMDNLFNDVHLAKTLLQLRIGNCGTVRLNALDIPPVLQAIKTRWTNQILGENQWTNIIVDDCVNCMAWCDNFRKKIVTMISTVHPATATEVAYRTAIASEFTRLHPDGHSVVRVRQPAIAVDYNEFMGATDNFNHLTQTVTCRRRGQDRWTTKYIEWMIDVAHVNSYLIWRSNPDNEDKNNEGTRPFTQILIQQLIEVPEKPHTRYQIDRPLRCAYTNCTPRPYKKRKVLGEVANPPAKRRTATTLYKCAQCNVALCNKPACWDAYHSSKGLPVQIEDCVEDE